MQEPTNNLEITKKSLLAHINCATFQKKTKWSNMIQ